MAVKAIPDGYRSVTPYLIVRGAARAIDFYKLAFRATERLRLNRGEGKIAHAEITIGDSIVMLADEVPEMGAISPETLGGVAGSLLIYLENVDEQFARALAAGAEVKRPVADQFYGDRSGTLIDPFGHVWTLATHTQEVSPEEMDRRFAEMLKKPANS